MKDFIVLSLGTNLGDRTHNIIDALKLIRADYTIIKCSNLYETKAQDDIDQKDFLNCAVLLQRTGSVHAILDRIKIIENKLGRVRDPQRPKGPRIIDIDIVFFGSELVNEKHLQVPHPRYSHRQFVLKPLIDILPEGLDPKTQKSFKSLYEDLEEQGVYSLDSSEYNNFCGK